MNKFEKGDIVLVGTGKVHWEVLGPVWDHHNGLYRLKSPMSGYTREAYSHELKPWTPGA